MDNHPIPQDVTGFQFRLIGDMTIKQFAYLAAGVVLAWICLSLPIFILFKLPLIVLFGGAGVILAFIPLAGRPADVMIFYFFKAVFSPTQYAYKSQNPQGNQQPMTALADGPKQEKKSEEKKDEKIRLNNPVDKSSFEKFFGEDKDANNSQAAPALHATELKQPEAPIAQVAPTDPSQPVAPAISSSQSLSDKATVLAKAILEAQKEEGAARDRNEAAQVHQRTSDLEVQLQSIQQQKQELETKLLELQKQLSQKSQQVFAPSVATAPKVTENVRKIPASLAKSVGTLFVTDVPNLICGIVKDPRGNVLPNILIEVKDRDGNPVRAFKTNPLGQFASATPVINGTYTLTFEDTNNKQRFDTVELSANGTVLSPIEVISIDAREDLRKELFG